MAIGSDILMIDDDRDLVQSIRIVLESRNYTFRSAFNGKEGYAKIQEKTPSLIILDVMMATDTEGFDLAYKLRNEPRYQSIPIIMVTAFPRKMAEEGPDKFQHILGESWPVSQFIEKPVDPELLLASVDKILGGTQKL
jgi:two-component system phosphate regulon response regulator PhoB/two-component system alkaline phosphatase synthesis response regulator PhoP/two-component system response regulator VicR